jgi:thioesterase domain-containing protein
LNSEPAGRAGVERYNKLVSGGADVWAETEFKSEQTSKAGLSAVMKQGREHHEETTRDEIAAQVRNIWEQAIGCSQVDEQSDFYFHGGDHHIAPVMIEAINAAMGMELTVRDLEQGRTIAKMTDLIYFERTRIDRSTVVPLRHMHGKRPPLFIVHGVGGNVLGFYSLAKVMDEDLPVYGIQAQALLPGREAVLSLEQMAAQYVADMVAAHPKGPYHLLGFSFGGLVAYEIARQLKAAGLEVGMVGMLDTRQPEWMRGVPVRGGLPRQVFMRLRLLYLRTHRRKGRIKYLWRRLGERMQRVSYMRAASKGGGIVANAVRNVREINYVAGISYSVKPYAGKVTLFRAEENPDEQPLPYDLNWGQFAQGGVSISELPGDHGRILYEPGLSALAKELTSALQRADAAAGKSAQSANFPGLEDVALLNGAVSNTGRVSMEI